MLKCDKKKVLDYNVYNISYTTKKPEYNINSANPLYLSIKYLNSFVDKVNGDKYLNIFLPDKNNRFVIKYLEIFDGIKEGIKKVNDGLPVVYDKDYMKIQFDSSDDLPLNRLINFHALTIVIRQLFQKKKCILSTSVFR